MKCEHPHLVPLKWHMQLLIQEYCSLPVLALETVLTIASISQGKLTYWCDAFLKMPPEFILYTNERYFKWACNMTYAHLVGKQRAPIVSWCATQRTHLSLERFMGSLPQICVN